MAGQETSKIKNAVESMGNKISALGSELLSDFMSLAKTFAYIKERRKYSAEQKRQGKIHTQHHDETVPFDDIPEQALSSTTYQDLGNSLSQQASIPARTDSTDADEHDLALIPELKPQLQLTPELHPELRPQLSPGLEPELQRQLTPELHPELRPQLSPGLEPELQRQLTPELRPVRQSSVIADNVLSFTPAKQAKHQATRRIWSSSKHHPHNPAAQLVITNQNHRASHSSRLQPVQVHKRGANQLTIGPEGLHLESHDFDPHSYRGYSPFHNKMSPPIPKANLLRTAGHEIHALTDPQSGHLAGPQQAQDLVLTSTNAADQQYLINVTQNRSSYQIGQATTNDKWARPEFGAPAPAPLAGHHAEASPIFFSTPAPTALPSTQAAPAPSGPGM